MNTSTFKEVFTASIEVCNFVCHFCFEFSFFYRECTLHFSWFTPVIFNLHMFLLFSVLGGKDSHQLCPSSKSFELSCESIIIIKQHDKLVTFSTMSPSLLLNSLWCNNFIPWWCCGSGKARNKVFLIFNLSICCLRTTSNVLTNNIVNTFPRGRGRVNYTIAGVPGEKP